MKLVCISDTHSYHRKISIPDGDVLIHCGDITWRGELPIIEDFSIWLKGLPHPNKLIIFGNHELGFEFGYKRPLAIDMIKKAGAVYLEDSGIEINGVKFWGSPIQPFFHAWEFNRHRGADIVKHWDLIPYDTNVLITHGPPAHIRDEAPRDFGGYENVGCKDLLNKIDNLSNLKAHIFGHIHAGYGTKQIARCTFVNASSCTEAYNPINAPIVIEV